MADKQAIRNAAWICLCLAALGAGYWLARLPGKPVNTAPAAYRSVPPGDMVLTEHTVSAVAKNAGAWVVSLDSDPGKLEKTPPDPEAPLPPLRTGTGMIVRSDGYIVTSNHVLNGVKQLYALLSDGRKFACAVVGRDGLTDIAVLKIDGHDLPFAKFASINSVAPGDFAIAIGTPLLLEGSVTMGVVSGVRRTVHGIAAHNLNLIQTDAAINPGNSGGPLLNIRGEVIGMNTAVSRRAQNIAFAVPSDEVQKVLDSIVKNGKVNHGFLALVMTDKRLFGNSFTDGVRVLAAMPDSLAGKAGVEGGDIIEAVNEAPVHDLTGLSRILIDCAAGQEITLRIHRGRQLKNIVVPLQDCPPPATGRPLSGLNVVNFTC